jgi:hypothetical protein
VGSVGGCVGSGGVDAPIFSRCLKNGGVCWNVLSSEEAGRVDYSVTLQKRF